MSSLLSTASSFISTGKTRVLPSLKEAAKIGDELTCDVIVNRETKFDCEVTEFPVEDGFSVADHCIRKPMGLTLEVLFTPTPVTWFNSALGGSQHTLNRVLNAVMAIWKAGEPITITLVDAIYTDMVMTSAPMPRRVEDGYCYKATLQFQHVRKVTQRTEEVDDESTSSDAQGKAGSTSAEGGSASTQDIGTGLTTVDSTTTTGIDTNNIDLSQYGSVGVGLEATAYMAASSITSCLGGVTYW